jgi:Flp pilus assembly protein TadG
MRTPANLLRDERGASIAEAAVALPVLVLIFAGVFSLGAMFFNTQLIETAARDGARFLARTDVPSANEAAARNVVVFANAGGSGAPRIPGLSTADVTISYRDVANPIDGGTGQRTYRGPDPLKVVRVEVSWEAAAGIWSLFGEDTVTYRAAHEQRVVGD